MNAKSCLLLLFFYKQTNFDSKIFVLHLNLLWSISSTCLRPAFTQAGPKSTKSCLIWLSFGICARKKLFIKWWSNWHLGSLLWPTQLQLPLIFQCFCIRTNRILSEEQNKKAYHGIKLVFVTQSQFCQQNCSLKCNFAISLKSQNFYA